MATGSFVVEFPKEMVELIDEIGRKLKNDRVNVISKAIGLLRVWVDARDNGRIIVERPQKGKTGEEYEIDVI